MPRAREIARQNGTRDRLLESDVQEYCATHRKPFMRAFKVRHCSIIQCFVFFTRKYLIAGTFAALTAVLMCLLVNIN